MIISHKSKDRSKRINESLNDRVSAGFEWGDHTFQIDGESRASIASRALKLVLNPDINSLVWRSSENDDVSFTRDQFLAFHQAVDEYNEQLRQDSWRQKDTS